VRFLHLAERLVGEFVPALAEWPDGAEPPFRVVEQLRIGDQVFCPWQEAEERQLELAGVALGDLLKRPLRQPFRFPGRRWREPLRGPAGNVAGVLVYEQQTVEGAIQVEAARVADGLFRVTVRVVNQTPLTGAQGAGRDAALLRSLV